VTETIKEDNDDDDGGDDDGRDGDDNNSNISNTFPYSPTVTHTVRSQMSDIV